MLALPLRMPSRLAIFFTFSIGASGAISETAGITGTTGGLVAAGTAGGVTGGTATSLPGTTAVGGVVTSVTTGGITGGVTGGVTTATSAGFTAAAATAPGVRSTRWAATKPN